MGRFLIDESMPRSTTTLLRQAGYYAEDVRDIGLRGSTDEAVYAYAQAHRLTLVTADKDFANVLRFPPGTHWGIIVVRVPDDQPTAVLLEELRRALAEQAGQPLDGLLLVVERGRTRVRRPPGQANPPAPG
jgi:predicted nuclease of predicted toxin-antitoxin system